MHIGLLRYWTLAGATAVALTAAIVGPITALARSPETQTTEGLVADGVSLFGSYIAGRIARGQQDTAAASEYYRKALLRDPDNEALMEQSLVMQMAEGDFGEAIGLAKRLIEKQPSHRMASLVLGLGDAKAGSYDSALERFKTTAPNVAGELTSVLARAWLLAGKGDLKAANDLIDNFKQAEWTQAFLRYHKALINDVAGRKADAKAAYERIFRTDARSLRVTLAYVQHLAASGDQKAARSVIDDYLKKNAGNVHPAAKALSDIVRNNERIGLLVDSPINGLAEVFYGLGEALLGDNNSPPTFSGLYLQMALFLQPDAPFALAALASYYERTNKHERAIASYDRVPKGHALQSAVDIRKALNLNQLERVDEAKQLLEALAAQDPTDLRALDALGTIMRARKRFDEAADYYSRIISIIGPKPEKKHWSYFYARGTCYERIKKWPLAEVDLQKAMQLAPDQPLVLNYLGYSWVDQSKNLKQGLALIEKAVNLKPDDGYIVDSLGWAHYRLGNYKDAVKYLERAVEIRPEDPVLNDHLGDAFWRVGRENEARFQWEQALTLKPEPDEVDKINRKISKGLPAKPQARAAKKSKEATRTDTPRKRTDNKLGTQRPVIE